MINNIKTLNTIKKAMQNGLYRKAISEIDVILKNDPNNVSYLIIRGEAYLRIENFDNALIDYAKAVEIDNKNIKALVNFAVALIRCSRHNDAKDILEYLLELEPNNFDAHINLCNVYQSLGKSEKCLQLSLRAIEIRPSESVSYNNLGTAFADLNMMKEAKEAYAIANQLDPAYIPTVINLAQVQIKLGNYKDGALLYENALGLKKITKSEKCLIKYYLGYAYLNTGNLEKGWDYYEFGYGYTLPVNAARSSRKFNQPRWNGEDLGDKRLLIWREQGLGDEIEFATCLHDVQNNFSNIILECEPRLLNIFKETFSKFEVRPESVGEDLYPLYEDFDVQCAIGSLPKIFRRSLESFNKYVPQLKVPQSSIDTFKNRLDPYKNKKLIGICWRSGLISIQRNDNYTSLSDWGDLLINKQFQFVNLQYGDCEIEIEEIETSLGITVLRWKDLDLKNDLENVMGLISNLNAVVTVGTAVSSLAGSCGVTTYLLIKRSWVLLGETNKYPWYECVKPLVAEFGEHVASKIKLIPDLILKN